MKKSLWFFFSGFISLIWNTISPAQINFYESQGRITAISAFSTNENSNNLGASFSYQGSPQFSFGASFRHLAFKDVNLGAYSFAPFISFYLIRQNNQFPLTSVVQAAYFAGSFNSSDLDQLGLKITSSGFNFNLSIFSEQLLSPFFSIIPGVIAEYIISNTKLRDNYGNYTKENSTITIFNFIAAFVFKANPNFFMFASPSISISEGETEPSISIGIGFKIKDKPKPKKAFRPDDLEPYLENLNSETTKLPNFRAAVPKAKKYSDKEILSMFRKKFPRLRNISDEKLIRLIERKYGSKTTKK